MREHYGLRTLTIHLPMRSYLPTRKNLPSILQLGSMKTNARVLYAANEVLYAILEIAPC